MNAPRVFALFPLPKVVALPGHHLQFHIFEPRYRKMISDCVERGMLLGIPLAFPKDIKRTKQLQDLLNSNQETFAPHAIFGAGPVKIMKTLEDGRLFVEIAVQERVQISRVVQNLPYVAAEGEILTTVHASPEAENILTSEIEDFSRKLLGRRYSSVSMNLASLIYDTLRWLILEPADNQVLLAENDISVRANFLISKLRNVHSVMEGRGEQENFDVPHTTETANLNDANAQQKSTPPQSETTAPVLPLSESAPPPPNSRIVARDGNLITPNFRGR